jgi:hypothetical protein
MSLESLQNPVSRLAVLPDGMSVNKNPEDNSPYWDVASQYYVNDVVLSSLNSGAYLMVGGATVDGAPAQTAVRGGDDPAEDATGNWIKLSQSSWEGYYNPTIGVPAAAATVIAITANAAYSAEPGYSYSVTFSGLSTTPLVQTAADWTRWTWTPSGTGALPLTIDVQPTVGSTTTNFSVSGVLTMGDVVAPPALDIITMSGAKLGAGQVTTITNARVTYTRLD